MALGLRAQPKRHNGQPLNLVLCVFNPSMEWKLMIDYGLAEYTASVMSNFLSAITIYFSIVTAYVVAAFVGGSKLTKLQLAIVNVSFTIAAGTMGTLSILLFGRFFELAALNQEASSRTPLVDFSYPLGILSIIVFLGSLVFMWSVRKDSK